MSKTHRVLSIQLPFFLILGVQGRTSLKYVCWRRSPGFLITEKPSKLQSKTSTGLRATGHISACTGTRELKELLSYSWQQCFFKKEEGRMSLEWTCHGILRWQQNNLGFRQLLPHLLPKLRIPITQESLHKHSPTASSWRGHLPCPWNTCESMPPFCVWGLRRQPGKLALYEGPFNSKE